jgi:hypothetical protein
MASQKSPWVYIGGTMIILYILDYGLQIWKVEHYQNQKIAEQAVDLTKYHYGKLVCEDAFQSDKDMRGTWEGNHHDYDKVRYVDIELKEGCFGGMVTLSDRWSTWRMQMLHNDQTAWVSFWYGGQPQPTKVFTLNEINQNPETMSRGANFMSFRLQGKGTLRIFTLSPP